MKFNLKRVHKLASEIRKRGIKRGDTVRYNVVTEDDYYNVEGDVTRVHKDGTFDVDTGDKNVSPENVALGMTHPAGVILIKSKKKLRKVV